VDRRRGGFYVCFVASVYLPRADIQFLAPSLSDTSVGNSDLSPFPRFTI
jgi:hypothetical protein